MAYTDLQNLSATGNPAFDNDTQATAIRSAKGTIGCTGITSAMSGTSSPYVSVPIAGTSLKNASVFGSAGIVKVYQVTEAQYAAAPGTAAGTLIATYTLSSAGVSYPAAVTGLSIAAGDFIYVVATISSGDISFRAEIS